MTLDLDLSGGPTNPNTKPLTAVQRGLNAIHGAKTRAQLEIVVASLRHLPEADKAQLRPAVKAHTELLRSGASVVATPDPAPTVQAPLMIVPTDTDEPTLPHAIVQATEAAAMGFGDIAAESAANAGVAAAGSLADGTMRGVGFSTREGYITALERGTTPATRTEYVHILQTRYHMGVKESDFPLIAQTALPVGPGIVHIPTGPSVFDLPRSQRTRIPVVSTEVKPGRREISNREVMAGAGAEATGVVTSWRGLGEARIDYLEAALTSVGAPISWAPPRKSAHFHASEALRTLNSNGRMVRAERGGTRAMPSLAGGAQRRYIAAWDVVVPKAGNLGAKNSPTVMRVQLSVSGDMEIQATAGNEGDRERVLADYQRRVRDEVLPAGDVTKWLNELLCRRMNAVRFMGGWYLPQAHKELGEAICGAVGRAWGSDWTLPAVPVATGEQLRAGLVRGFVDEVNRLLTELEGAREAARALKRADVTAGTAAGFLARLKVTNDRAKEYALLLGEASVASVSRAISEALTVLEPLCDDTAQRFAALEAY